MADEWRKFYQEKRKAEARAEVLAELKAEWKGKEQLPDGPDTAALPTINLNQIEPPPAHA